MIAYKARIKLKDLKRAIRIPPEISSSEVEIIILSEPKVKTKTVAKKLKKNIAGIFHEYTKSELIKDEKDIAWSKVIYEKHGIL